MEREREVVDVNVFVENLEEVEVKGVAVTEAAKMEVGVEEAEEVAV